MSKLPHESSHIKGFLKDENICLIDADSLVYYEMDKNTYEEAVYGLDKRIDHILKQCNTTKFAGFLTDGCWVIPILEADDLVSYYANTDNRKFIICSPDKDVLHQCIGTHYNYRTTEFLHTSPEDAIKFLWKQALMGDSVDGIPGLPGVGDKTATNWLKSRTKDFEGFTLRKYVEHSKYIN